MQVDALMTSPVATCRPTDTLNRVAQLMWEGDCGAIPVVDDEGKPVAMITDRDVCIASYTQGKPLYDIPVAIAMSRNVTVCQKTEPLATAESLMRGQQIRRLPVVGSDGRIVGILSLNDIAIRAHQQKHLGARGELGSQAIASTLSAICARSPVEEAAQ
ncbi:CBS domain-containing protein [soil metagenome]